MVERNDVRHRIVVAGMLAADPCQGGATWAVLQYVLGLRQLGHEVIVVDPLPAGPICETVASYFTHVCAEFHLQGRAALVPSGGSPLGMDDRDLSEYLDGATILVNLSGRWRVDERVEHLPIRVYVDLDPAFTQLWHAHGADVGLDHHTHHVTVGAGVTGAHSVVPSIGIDWRPILPPVLLDEWPMCPPPSSTVMTTIANWRSYGSIEHNGQHFGQKAHSFRELVDLPSSTTVPLAIALSIDAGDDADRLRLSHAGWLLVDAVAAAGDPHRYRTFVQDSWAEIGVAKQGYVVGRTGWVSDRTACYLASGRPAVVQDTGLADVFDVGEGLITFTDTDDAADAIERLAVDYQRHASAARRLAEEHLDSRIVLGGLLRDITA